MKLEYFVPMRLQNLRTWILWKMELIEGRLNKTPYQLDGEHRASTTNPCTWGSYTDAVCALSEHPDCNGLGFVFVEKYRLVFCDIDHCINDDGTISEIADDILNAFQEKTYVEVSQSGSGLHIIAVGEIARGFNNRKYGVEMYCDGRYVAFTGNCFIKAEPAECQEAIDYVFEKYKTRENNSKSLDEYRAQSRPDLIHSDVQIVKMASRNMRFRQLYEGNYEAAGYGSHSEADIALCNALAFWCDRDPDRIDRIFRTSELYREKWEREDYRSNTIQKACGYISESFSQWREKRTNEFIECQLHHW